MPDFLLSCCGHSLAAVTRGDDELRRVALSAPALKIILCQPFIKTIITKKQRVSFTSTALESLDRDEENLAELAKNENNKKKIPDSKNCLLSTEKHSSSDVVFHCPLFRVSVDGSDSIVSKKVYFSLYGCSNMH